MGREKVVIGVDEGGFRSSLGQRNQDVGMPGAVEAECFIQLEITGADIEPGGMDARQDPPRTEGASRRA